jgi:hypothetical protein
LVKLKITFIKYLEGIKISYLIHALFSKNVEGSNVESHSFINSFFIIFYRKKKSLLKRNLLCKLYAIVLNILTKSVGLINNVPGYLNNNNNKKK